MSKLKEKLKSGKPSGSCAYFLGFIGASFYFISSSIGFWAGFVGFLKAIVWPAFMVYEVFHYVS